MNYTELTESDRAVLQHAIDASDRLYVQGIQEVGAALRTTGGPRLQAFLDANAAAMPRPMLRNAIEKLEPKLRQHYLALGKER